MNSKVSSPSLSRECPTPLGTLRITATDQGIVSILFPDENMEPINSALASSGKTQAPKLRVLKEIPPQPMLTATSKTTAANRSTEAHLEQAITQLQQYFSGERRQFSLTLAPIGSGFQQQVWLALGEIPFAHSCSYGAIANHLQNPKAVRAVGAANGRNPIAIVVPCHRVIGANGSLTGYAGGLHRKLWLLQHEMQCAGSA
jgi:methylated-DNA-[protein]-cysteine S-methyltransferase